MIDPAQKPIRVTPHDEVRLAVGQQLTALMSQCAMMPVMHQGHLTDMLDIALRIARVLDSFEFESVEMTAWMQKHGQHERVTEKLVEMIRAKDWQGLESYSHQLVYEHPLPVTAVDASVERVQKSA